MVSVALCVVWRVLLVVLLFLVELSHVVLFGLDCLQLVGGADDFRVHRLVNDVG